MLGFPTAYALGHGPAKPGSFRGGTPGVLVRRFPQLAKEAGELYRSQRLLEVGEQITPVFDADGDAHEAVCDSRLLELLFGKAGMCGGLGMTGEGFHTAERHGVSCDLQMAKEIERASLAAFNFERKHSAGIIALGGVDAFLFGIGEKRRIEDALDFLVFNEALGDALRVDAGFVHAQAHRGEAAREQPALIGLQDGAEEAARRANLADQLRVSCESDAREHVAEAGKVLCTRIKNEIGAKLQRMLKRWAKHRVIDQRQGGPSAAFNFQRSDRVADLL